MLRLSRIAEGESVLDVGCGTGTLAILAKQRVGAAGSVSGIDPSPEMIARATRKAQRRGADVAFQTATAQALPFPDGRFDLVLSTLMLHHLARSARAECLAEIRRVLVPGGRLLVVDFETSERPHGIFRHLHRSHGPVAHDNVTALVRDAGLTTTEHGPVGFRDLHFTLAMKS